MGRSMERDMGGLAILVSQQEVCLLLVVHLFVVLAFSSHKEIMGFICPIKMRQGTVLIKNFES